MAVKKEITMVVKPDGTVEMETHGFKGTECEAELKPFENALGKASQRKRTQEFYEKSPISGNTGQKRKIGSPPE